MSTQPKTFSSDSRFHGAPRPKRKHVVLIMDMDCARLDHDLCAVEHDTRNVVFRCGCKCHETAQTRLF